jgi:hypothetical protein
MRVMNGIRRDVAPRSGGQSVRGAIAKRTRLAVIVPSGIKEKEKIDKIAREKVI